MNHPNVSLFIRRVGALSVCSLLASACVDEAAEPAVDAASAAADDAVATTQRAAGATSTAVPVADFVGSYDPELGEFTLEVLAPTFTEAQLDASELRGVEQALWCPVRATAGARDTIALTTDAASIFSDAVSCGLPDAFPFSTLGAFCADVTARSAFTDEIDVLVAEFTEITPTAGYNAYSFATSGGLVGVDLATLPGPNVPIDALGGPFSWGTLAPGASETVKWVFQNDGAPFTFRGRLMATLAEDCTNQRDDNCDGIINDGCGFFVEGDACFNDADCDSNFCFGADALAGFAGICEAGGCTDAGASNFDGTATVDDGSCVYTTTLDVDVNCAATLPVAGEAVFVSVDGTVVEATDINTDGIWEATFDAAPGTVSYTYSIGTAGGLVAGPNAEDVSALSCANGAARELTVTTGTNTASDIWGGCGGCYVINPTGDASVSVNGVVSNRSATASVVGHDPAFEANDNQALVLPFELPAIPAGEQVNGATLDLVISSAIGSNSGTTSFNTDLYGLGLRASGAAVAGDYFAGGDDVANSLLVMDFVPFGTAVASHDPANPNVQRLTGSTLIDYLNNNNTAGQFLTFRLSTDAELTGNAGVDFVEVKLSTAGFPSELPRLAFTTDFLGDPGCMDAGANNFDAAADYDDGTCEYDVTHCVDFGCSAVADSGAVGMNVSDGLGGFTFVPMTETGVGTGIYCVTQSLVAGDFTYVNSVDGGATDEVLLDEVWRDRSCSPAVDTDGETYAYRTVNVAAAGSYSADFQRCGTCPLGTALTIPASPADGRLETSNGDPVDKNAIDAVFVQVGEFFSPGSSNYIVPFTLPERGAGGTVHSAELRTNIQTLHGAPLPPFNVDLYARVVSSATDWSGGDHFEGPLDGGGSWTLVQDDILTPADDWRVGPNYTNDAGALALGTFLNNAYIGGAVEGDVLLLRFSPDVTPIPVGFNAWDIFTANALGAGQKPTLVLDQDNHSFTTPIVFGCTNAAANNFSAAANSDDGTCEFDVTFVLDTSCRDNLGAGGAMDNYRVASEDWAFDPANTTGQMTSVGDTASVTLSLTAGVFTYTYFGYNGVTFVDQEDVLDDAIGGAACAPENDGATFAYRQVGVAGPTTVTGIYGECTSCPPPPSSDFDIVADSSDARVQTSGGSAVVDASTNTTVEVGEYFNPGGANFIAPFQMPTLANNEYISSATLRVQLSTINNAGLPFNGDLWGLPFRAASTPLAADYLQGSVDSAATLVANDMLTPASGTFTDVTASGASLIDYLNSGLAAGGNGDFAILRLNPDIDVIPVGLNNYVVLTSEAGNASERPQLSLTVTECDPGEAVDCSGACVAGDIVGATGDSVCDNTPGFDLNCARFAFDGGDCAGVCPAGQTLACDGSTCVNDAFFGNGTCEATLDCAATAFDHFDCTGAQVGACAAGELEGADASCLTVATAVAQFDNGVCNAGLDSAAFGQDGGDCCNGGAGGTIQEDCDGAIICDPTALSGDGFCDSLYTEGAGNLLCFAEGYEGNDCAGPCAAGEVPTCGIFGVVPYNAFVCAAAEDVMSSAGDSTCDSRFDCRYYRMDGGDCADNGAQSACVDQGDVLDCEDNCSNSTALNFWDDAFCDEGAAPEFACAEWSWDYDPITDGSDGTPSGDADCDVNLLSNGDFEAGVTGWIEFPVSTEFSAITDSGFFFGGDPFTPGSGTGSLKLFSNGAEGNVFQEFDSLAVGQAYQFSGTILVANQEAFDADNQVNAFVKFWEPGFTNPTELYLPVGDAVQTQDVYAPFSVCGVMPVGATIGQAGLVYAGGSGNGTVFGDDFVFEPVASCPGSVSVTLPNLTEGAFSYDALQAAGASSVANGGGTPTADARTLYVYTPDTANADPTYAGGSWPFVVVPDGADLTAAGTVNASLSTRYVAGTGRVLTVGGLPVYQFASDTATTMSGAFFATWYAMDENGDEIIENSTPGCTDSDANNYNAAATIDNGSCMYDVTIEVDVTCRGLPGYQNNGSNPPTVYIANSPTWTGTDVTMTDVDNDGVWTVTQSMAPGTVYTYKHTINGWGGSDENISGDGACDIGGNRELTVGTAPVTVSNTYGSCGSCPTFNIAAGFCANYGPGPINGGAGTTWTLFGQIFVSGLTDVISETLSPDYVTGEFGYGPVGADASTFTYFTAPWTSKVGNNFEAAYSMTLPAAGSYDVVYRATGDGGATYAYCNNGGGVAANSSVVSRHSMTTF